ncbi:MAG TPA: hypothetical protein VKD21_05530 [Acidimicrobiales bacterium]|nr:hypothetical protein [Acidimicrobiales bacterium]
MEPYDLDLGQAEPMTSGSARRSGARGPEVRFFMAADWAHRFPSEQVGKLRKR